MEAEKAKVRKEYERKEASVDVKRKMCGILQFVALCAQIKCSEYSTQLNAMRLKVLAAREASMASLLAEAAGRLASFAQANNKGYKSLLVALLAQAVAQLGGVACTVRCRTVDAALVAEVCTEAKSGARISVDQASPLAPPPDAARPDAPHSLGGLVVCTLDGKTTVDNTLEERLAMAYQANVPELRQLIFGKSGGHLRG